MPWTQEQLEAFRFFLIAVRDHWELEQQPDNFLRHCEINRFIGHYKCHFQAARDQILLKKSTDSIRLRIYDFGAQQTWFAGLSSRGIPVKMAPLNELDAICDSEEWDTVIKRSTTSDDTFYLQITSEKVLEELIFGISTKSFQQSTATNHVDTLPMDTAEQPRQQQYLYNDSEFLTPMADPVCRLMYAESFKLLLLHTLPLPN
jgi:hypothetical protein